jgi:glycosyltransferase involved in cell wall biosynthesis
MSGCIESLLVVGEEAQIIIVDDGSTDDTQEIAQDFERRFPGIVEVVSQENSGWGEGVNQGIARARGAYFKIVDSDDHLEASALAKVIETLRSLEASSGGIDLLVTNFVYDHKQDNTTHTIDYRKMLPANKIFAWDELGTYSIDQYFMVHALYYRTQVIRDSGLRLPTHAFYMDSIFVLHPIPYVKRLYYLDIDVYYYLIGRADQSINMDVLKARIDQQLLATRMAIGDYDIGMIASKNVKMAECMARYICAMMSVSTVYLFLIGTPEALEKNRELWDFLKQKDIYLFKIVCHSPAGAANRKTAPGRLLTKVVYLAVKKIFKFA